MKIVTYTASIGKHDKPRNDALSVSYGEFKSDRRNARTCKLLSHLFVDADVSVWIDANIYLKVPQEQLVEMLDGADVGVFRHCERDTIYEEADACIAMKKDSAENIMPQVNRYSAMGYFARDLGMTFVLVRRHTDEVRRRNERWHAELTRHSVRDQVSFPVVFDGLVNYWPVQPLTSCAYYERRPHGR